MKQENQNIWIGTEDLNGSSAFVEQASQEFFNVPVLNDLTSPEIMEDKSKGTSRRDFLKYMGFGIGAATIAASCEIPVRRALPYVIKPDTIVPGIATYYTSVYSRGGNFCPILVKTREGRPIKIEGNPMTDLMRGGTSARVQASVLDLYDTSRLRNPGKLDKKGLAEMSWADLDKEVKAKLATGNIRILTNTQISPSVQSAIAEFTIKYPSTKVVTYDPVSYSGMLLANERSFGQRVIPGYRFDNAKVVVNFGADFLGTWLSPIEFAAQWSKNRQLRDMKNRQFSRLIQFESGMSLTGSNADNRLLIKPSERGLAIAKLYNAVASSVGAVGISVAGTLSNAKAESAIKAAAKDLLKNKGAALVISSSNNASEQVLINTINDLVGSYGSTISFANANLQKQGIDKDVIDLMAEMNAGQVSTLIVLDDANPIYDLPEGNTFKTALEKVALKVSLTTMPSETAMASTYVAPTPHYLESWGDAMPYRGFYSIQQPTINPLFKTRSVIESLLVWSDQIAQYNPADDITYQYVQKVASGRFFGAQSKFSTSKGFWENLLFDGYAQMNTTLSGVASKANVVEAAANISKPSGAKLEASFYEPVAIGAGQNANNPWLQEMPDPVTRSVWDNFVAIPIQWNGTNDFTYFNDLAKDGMLVDVNIKGNKDRLPVLRQFGQMEGTVAIALGYGREVSGKAGEGVGKNMFKNLTRDADGNIQYFSAQVEVSKEVGFDHEFATVQHHHSMGLKGKDASANGAIINVDEKALMTLGDGFQGSLVKRSILRESHFDKLDEKMEALAEERKEFQHLNSQSLYGGHEDLYRLGHNWGMSVDLSSCVGCGSCQVACVAENNVPMVGKREVSRHHEMTWLRIDRYYYGDIDSPNVVYQPMMCQHCENAPCENVCPVNATNHSSEGLNQMAYNRCVGTRYCANNCPYKVRRFNWFDFTTADLWPSNEEGLMTDQDVPFYADNLTRMVLNPDVTVRSRGVIEKCSLCVQRIQEGKLSAKRENRTLRDGDVRTACQTACPTGSIIFGDTNDPESQLMKIWSLPSNYFVLEETNVKPGVGYQMKITNQNLEISGKEA